MKSLFILLPLLLLFSCNTEEKNRITNTADYEQYLVSKKPDTTSKYFELWNNKIKEDSTQLSSFGIVASQYDAYFKATGDIEYLKKAEKSLQKAVEIAATGRAGFRRELARNYISQHRFKEALFLAEEAQEIGSGITETHSLLFDVHMELGNYNIAKEYLNKITDPSSFGYLIRAAKWNDYKGELPTTINYMEQAKQLADRSTASHLKVWSYTNLADYYGHAGRIKDSYEHYLKTLAIDPQNSYAKKGIAWIVFSYEKNPEEALRILDSITKNYDAPDYYLLKSEIASYQNNRKQELLNLDEYLIRVKNKAYGDMYNAYNVDLYTTSVKDFEKALALSKREVQNRPTPESYSLLAYTHLKLGDNKKALAIVENHIEGKTFEPAILLRSAEIYKVAGNNNKVKELKNELSGAVYELGPNMLINIESL
ncbi:hypothetical protein KO500_12990 [Cellulophaga baltica]|uniref:tetratricopeptide repeat protein n=1 Tax=Cellulophaga TaxID=104264 RepID=UPI001C07B798|nr:MULTISPECIES: hypothetical protein [Cellulophaga]MBU2997356.1 hypothetical protein [Cellulophaga baltica]MDO6768752.1 hypothetical protein [Cellulophaga sp. 1_MG-2023]